MSNASPVLVCAYCGAESATWTAFCVRCGVPRATAAPAGAEPSAQVSPAAHAAVPAAAAVPPAYAQPLPGTVPGTLPAQPGQFARPGQPVLAGQLAQPQFAPGAARPAVADVFVPPGLAPEFGDLVAAGTGRRIAAFSIDAAVVALVSILVAFFTGSPLLAGLAAVELAVGLLVWEANRGKTIGNTILRLRTTRAEQPRTAGPVRAGIRGLVIAGGLLIGTVGAWIVVASTAWDRNGRKQGWHDRAGRTVTVALPAGRRTTTSTVRESTRAGVPVRAAAPVRAGAAGGSGVAEVAPATATAAATPVGFVSAATSAPEAAAAVPVAESAGSAADSAGRADEIDYISPTVMSTRMTIEEVDDDSFSDAGQQQVAAQPSSVQPSPAQPAPVASAVQVMLFAFDTGQQIQVPVPGTGVIGRNPRAFTDGDQLIAIDDPAKSMSKSHLLYSLTEGVMQVLDYGSTNGSEILDDEGDSHTLVAGAWTVVPAGSRVRVGQRVFTISAVEVTR